MLSIFELFSLVKSLTKTEKRYFRMNQNFQDGDKGYMRLYDILESSERYNETLLCTIQETLGPSAVEPGRKHLAKVLTKSLNQFEGDKIIESKLWSLYQNSITLHKRGIYSAAMRVIQKAEKLAIEYEKHLFIHIINKKKGEYMMHQQFVDWDESALILTHEKSRDALNAEQANQQHAALYQVLQCRYWKNGTVRSTREQAQLNDLILEEHFTITSNKQSTFESNITHLQFQSTFFLVTGDTESSLQMFYELDQLYQTDPKSWLNAPYYHIQFLTGILQTLRRVEKFDKMSFFMDRLKTLQQVSEYQNLRIRYQILEHELHILIAHEDISKIELFLLTLPEESEKQFALIPYQDQAQWWFTQSRAWFEVGDYIKALHHINRILNNNLESINNLQYATYRIFKLIIHYHLGDHDYLDYEMRSMERKLKKENQWYGTERCIISLLRREINLKSVTVFKEELFNLKNDPYEQHIITELALFKWLNKWFG